MCHNKGCFLHYLNTTRELKSLPEESKSFPQDSILLQLIRYNRKTLSCLCYFKVSIRSPQFPWGSLQTLCIHKDIHSQVRLMLKL